MGTGPASRRLAVFVALAGSSLLPTPVLAADVYIDKDTGNNSPNPCTQAEPCQNIFHGLTVAGVGDTVFVDDSPTAYTEQVTINGGESLVAQEFVGGDEGPGVEPDTVIDGTTASAVTADNAPAGTLSGFSLLGGTTVVNVQDDSSITIANNLFADSDANSIQVIGIQGGPTTVDQNTFTDSSPTDDQSAIQVFNEQATITGNSIAGFREGIFMGGPGEITGNTITGIHALTPHPPGVGISIQGAEPTVTANHIHSPSPTGTTIGVGMSELGATGATFKRNRIFDHSFGVSFTNTSRPVTFESDVIANGSNRGIDAQDFTGGTRSDFTATNVTLFDNGGTNPSDIVLTDTVATLNSTIVGSPITASPDASCDLRFSAGPTQGGGPCESFQFSNANPMFANPDGGDYHLLPGSPLIDIGDPAAPAAGALDFDGDPRAIDADGACPLDRVRDIGADEFSATEPNCPAATIPLASPAPVANPACEELRSRLARLNRKIKQTDDLEQKAKLKGKRRKIRKQLAALGC